ncbi:MAG: GlxA family transcriptional regulator [Acidimicrobiales bacterium]
MTPRRIAVVAFEDAQSLDVCGPLEVFAAATQILTAADRPGYDVGVTTMDGTPARCSSGVTLGGRWTLTELDDVDTLVVAGGRGNRAASQDAAFLAEIRRVAAGSRRVGSVCTGAFVLAAAGLLDHRRATTHWASTARLAREHPLVEVQPDAIYTRDDDVWTSAGVTAGIDLALALVADDHDDEVARQVSQWLVMYLRRSGGQSQFSAPVSAVGARRDEIRRAQDWIAADPSRDCSVDALAAVAAMSPRHFARVFREQVGVTPARYVEACRVDVARSLLETTDLTVAEVAGRSGVGDPSTLHRLFDRHLSTTPAAYRTHHATSRRSSR